MNNNNPDNQDQDEEFFEQLKENSPVSKPKKKLAFNIHEYPLNSKPLKVTWTVEYQQKLVSKVISDEAISEIGKVIMEEVDKGIIEELHNKYIFESLYDNE